MKIIREETRQHFEVEEMPENTFITENTEKIGQDRFILLAKSCGMKKARIIIDYDTGFPYVLVRMKPL